VVVGRLNRRIRSNEDSGVVAGGDNDDNGVSGNDISLSPLGERLAPLSMEGIDYDIVGLGEEKRRNRIQQEEVGAATDGNDDDDSMTKSASFGRKSLLERPPRSLKGSNMKMMSGGVAAMKRLPRRRGSTAAVFSEGHLHRSLTQTPPESPQQKSCLEEVAMAGGGGEDEVITNAVNNNNNNSGGSGVDIGESSLLSTKLINGDSADLSNGNDESVSNVLVEVSSSSSSSSATASFPLPLLSHIQDSQASDRDVSMTKGKCPSPSPSPSNKTSISLPHEVFGDNLESPSNIVNDDVSDHDDDDDDDDDGVSNASDDDDGSDFTASDNDEDVVHHDNAAETGDQQAHQEENKVAVSSEMLAKQLEKLDQLSQDIRNLASKCDEVTAKKTASYESVLSKLKEAVGTLWTDGIVLTYGSYASGLMANHSDLDVVICWSDQHNNVNNNNNNNNAAPSTSSNQSTSTVQGRSATPSSSSTTTTTTATTTATEAVCGRTMSPCYAIQRLAAALRRDQHQPWIRIKQVIDKGRIPIIKAVARGRKKYVGGGGRGENNNNTSNSVSSNVDEKDSCIKDPKLKSDVPSDDNDEWGPWDVVVDISIYSSSHTGLISTAFIQVCVSEYSPFF
jgi:hypothetical protein